MQIFSDKISSGGEDLLGRQGFASEITKALLTYAASHADGITLSITGEWGSGKSTLLQYIKKALVSDQNRTSIQVIEFNPWIFYKEGNIREAFLIHFAVSLKGFESTTGQLSRKLKDFVSAFRFLKNISTVAGNAQEGVEKALEFFAQNDSLPALKEEIEKLLQRSDKKIIILMDDIDRLTSSEILELLQVVSLVMNFSNVHYLLAFDKEIVVNAINKEFQGKGLDYLEKIIQVDYTLPRIRKEKLEQLFFQYIMDLSKRYHFSFDEPALKSLWAYHGLGEYFTTMRDFKRFFNSLSFRLPLIVEDVNVADFIAIEAIRLFDNEGYNLFYTFYTTNLRRREIPATLFQEDQMEQFKQPTADVVKALSSNSVHNGLREDASLKRIYDAEYFDRYFSLLRNDSDISERELKEFMLRPESRSTVLLEAAKYNRMENLIKRLNEESIAQHFSHYDFGVVEALVTYFNSYCATFEAYCDTAADAIINLVCATTKRETYLKTFFSSFRDHTAFPSIVHIYFFHYMRLFKKEDRTFRGRHTQFDDFYKLNFDLLCKKYLVTFERSAPSLFTERYTLECPFIKYLYTINYAELFPEKYVLLQAQIFKDKLFLVYVISQMISLKDDLSLYRYDFRHKELLFPGSSFLYLKIHLQAIDWSTLDEKQKAYITHFFEIVDKGSNR